MSATTLYTCDGCGVAAEERSGTLPLNWVNPYFPGYGYKYWCAVCAPRVAHYGECLSCPSPEVEAACALLREEIEKLERRCAAEQKRQGQIRDEMAEARVSHVEALAEAQRANERVANLEERVRDLAARATKAAAEADRLTREAVERAHREESLEDALHAARVEIVDAARAWRCLVREVLGFLGRKSRRRNKRRLREIRLAVADAAEGDAEGTP